MSNDPLKQISLVDELTVAVALIKGGLRELQQIDGANNFYHLPFLTSASGFERMMKIIICLHIHEVTGSFPSKFPWPGGKRGHDLIWLLDYVVRNCYSDNYLKQIPVAHQDITFLREDKRTRTIVRILSDFGQADRYYNFNIISGKKSSTGSPEQQWEKLEMEILRDNPNWADEIQTPSGLVVPFERINTYIVARLEQFARALCRLFTIGGLGDNARQASPFVYDFLMIQDDKLGSKRY